MGRTHYPFENKERFEAHFPADFIAEGLDQTRGWFYTLLVLSTALFDKPAFKNVVVNGLVLAEDGQKMSKRLKNYPDPTHIFDTYGADALRAYLINSPVVRAEDLRFSEEGVKQCLRDFLIPWWNAYSFFVTYARIDKWGPVEGGLGSGVGATPATSHPPPSTNLLDRWILSAMERLNLQVTEAMDKYDLQSSIRPFVHFIDQLTNWYIRRSRRRFWKSKDDADKIQAYATLYAVLLRLCKIAAPFVPFISEAIYRNLRTPDMPESVHLRDFPQADAKARDVNLEAQMDEVIQVVELGRQVRTQHDLKVRQPLRQVRVVCHDQQRLERIRALKELVAEELNVREVAFSAHETDLAALSAKADFKRLGAKLGPKMKAVAEAIRGLTGPQIESLLDGQTVTVQAAGEAFAVTKDDIFVERQPKAGLAVASAGNLVVALDTQLDDDLIGEGLAREFVNKVQNLRKVADLDIAQRIRVRFDADDVVRTSVERHRGYVEGEILAIEFKAAPGELGVQKPLISMAIPAALKLFP